MWTCVGMGRNAVHFKNAGKQEDLDAPEKNISILHV